MQRTSLLGEMLLESGLIDQFQLDSALSMQRNLGGQIGSALVKLGYLPQETITEFLESQEKCSQLPLEELLLSSEILSLLPLERMEELTVFPVELRKTGNEKILRVAMPDVENLQLIDKLQFLTGCRVTPLQAAADEILCAIDNNTPDEPPLGSTESPDSNDPVFSSDSVDFSVGMEADPRFDRLLDVLKDKGILSPFDIDRIKLG